MDTQEHGCLMHGDLNCCFAETNLREVPGVSEIANLRSEVINESIEPPVLTTLRSWKTSSEWSSQQREVYNKHERKKNDEIEVQQSVVDDNYHGIAQFQESRSGNIKPQNGKIDNFLEGQTCRTNDTSYYFDYAQQSLVPTMQSNTRSDVDFTGYSEISPQISAVELTQLDKPSGMHGFQQVFQARTTRQSFPSLSLPIVESSHTHSPFQVLSNCVPKLWNERIEADSDEWATRRTIIPDTTQELLSSFPSYNEGDKAHQHIDDVSTVSACFPKQAHVASRQHQFSSMQVQNADIQHLLITQTKMRQHRSTSIRIIEYNDIEQQEVFQNEKSATCEPVILPFGSKADGACSQQSDQRNTVGGYASNADVGGTDMPRRYLEDSHFSHSLYKNITPENRGESSCTSAKNEFADECSILPSHLHQADPFTSWPSEDANLDRTAFRNSGTETQSTQNSPFFVSHGSLFCGQMSMTPLLQRTHNAALESSWRGNISHRGYSFDSYGMMDLRPGWRGSITGRGTNYFGENSDSSNRTAKTEDADKGILEQSGNSADSSTSRETKVPVRIKSKVQKNRRFVCSHLNCNKKYFKQAHLEMHLRKHAGERPYSCVDCGKGFQRSDQLKRHRRSHTGEKPYLCRECGKAFARSDHLKTHRKTHAGKPYTCQWENCKKKFAHPDELCRHQVSHTSTKTKSSHIQNSRERNVSVIHSVNQRPPSSGRDLAQPSSLVKMHDVHFTGAV